MDREQQILALIRHNPFITQNEIAGNIGISRSAVAGYIASLTKKGILRGRAYITSADNSVICIGGANLDSKATSKRPIRPASSNPAYVQESCGGVARNIAENLAHLSCTVQLMTVVGDDQAGVWVLKETARSGVNTSLCSTLPKEKTGTYTAFLNNDGEMYVAFADMDIYDQMDASFIRDKWPHIAASKLVIVDANMSADGLSELVKRCNESQLPLFVDPVSSEKSKKLPGDLTGITALFPNLEEALELAGVAPSDSPPDYARLAEALRERGVQHVYMTLGDMGVLYSGEDGSRLFPSITTKVVEVTGAGDAFLAGVAYAVLQGHSYAQACQYGQAAAHHTLQTADSVSALLNEQMLQLTVKERSL
jgi:pseudouridine kinase